MELTVEVCAVLSPNEMRTLRKTHAGMTLETLSRLSRVSIPQLSNFETGQNGLTLEQVKTCERILLRAAAEREQNISKLFSKRAGTMAAAS